MLCSPCEAPEVLSPPMPHQLPTVTTREHPPRNLGPRGCLSLSGRVSAPEPLEAPGEKQAQRWEQAQKATNAAVFMGAPPQEPGLSAKEVQELLDGLYTRVKEELIGEVKQEVKALSQSVQEGNKALGQAVGSLAEQLRAMREEARAEREERRARGPLAALGELQRYLCSPPGASAAAHSASQEQAGEHGGQSSPLPVCDEPRPSVVPPSTTAREAAAAGLDARALQRAGAEKAEKAVAPQLQAPPQRGSRASAGREAAVPASPEKPKRRFGALRPVIERFAQATSAPAGTGRPPSPVRLQREPFVQGLEAYAQVLDALGGKMGGYLLDNVRKLRGSRASAAEADYRAWLLSELPVHGASGYKEYVDPSAWMGNLWIGWLLEFFVEFFAQLHGGGSTRESVDKAYQQTLYNHHNFFQRTAFTAAVKQIPDRERLLQALRGAEGASAADVLRDLGSFVELGRPIVRYCLQVNDELDRTMQAERRRSLQRRG